MPDGFAPEMKSMPSAPEMPPQGEQFESAGVPKIERVRESVGEDEVAATAAAEAALSSSATAVAQAIAAKDEYHVRIEQVLDEHMEDVVRDMTPAKQEEFRQVKEETAANIRVKLGGVKVHFVEILVLIQKWLMLIPSVSRFFLEQESKIKTDKIKKIADELRAARVA